MAKLGIMPRRMRIKNASAATVGALLLVGVSLATPSARAASGFHEVIFGFGALNLGTSTSFSSWTIGYNFPFKDWLQLGGLISSNYQGINDVQTSTFDLMVGGTMNFAGGISDGVFANVAVLYRSVTTTPATATPAGGLGLAIHAGKKFVLFGPLRYRPNIGMIIQGGIAFYFVPIQFSVMF